MLLTFTLFNIQQASPLIRPTLIFITLWEWRCRENAAGSLCTTKTKNASQMLICW